MPYSTILPTTVLADHLDGAWAILDCRFDLQDDARGHREYLSAHIPGAVYVSLSRDLAGSPSGRNGRHPLPSVDTLAETFGRCGISRDTQVVAYDGGDWLFASRLWWTLRYLGHDAVAVLDGGWPAWCREGRPTRAGDEARTPAVFRPAPRPQMVVTIDDIAHGQPGDERLLVDARSPERYAGETEPIDRRAGHIPGARTHHYRQNLAADGTLLPADLLRERFERLLAGRSPRDTVMYCGSGVSACQNLLAMEEAGLPGAALYPGSWSEWSADPSREVETGTS